MPVVNNDVNARPAKKFHALAATAQQGDAGVSAKALLQRIGKEPQALAAAQPTDHNQIEAAASGGAGRNGSCIGRPAGKAVRNDCGVIERVVDQPRSEEHTSELQSRGHLVCRLLLEKKKP